MKTVRRVPFIIGTAGHIDHGKTTLVKALTGIDTDRLADEKKRGVSIDLGFAHIDIPAPDGGTMRAAIVDVPGHERFIRNMLAGTTGIDMVLFVVAADDGVMPQTREHLDIVNLLGVSRGVFVITKTDIVPDERVAELKREIEDLISETLLEGSPVVAASALTGEGLDTVRGLLTDGLSARSEDRAPGPVRLPIDRSFTVKGFGTVVTGTVASGRVARGDELVVFPTGAKVKVRGIQSLYMETDTAGAGERAAVNVSGVSHNDVERGQMLAAAELSAFADFAASGAVMRVDAAVDFVARSGGGRKKIRNHAQLKLHHFAGSTLARVVFPGRKGAGPGEKAPARLVLRSPLLMLRGDRFILRDPADNTTVGGGVVSVVYLDRRYTPPVDKITSSTVPVRGGVPAVPDPVDAVRGLVDSIAGVGLDTLSLMVNTPSDELEGLIKDSSDMDVIAGMAVSRGRLVRLKESMLKALEAHHSAAPSSPGLAENALIRSAGGRGDAPVAKAVLAGLAGEGMVVRKGSTVSLATHAPALTGVHAEIEARLRAIFDRGLPPPSTEELNSLGYNKKELARVLAHMVDTGRVVKLKEGSWISAPVVREAEAKLRTHIKAKGPIRAAAFRDILGCGRKLAIEILEYFDKVNVTIRSGDERALRDG